MHRVRWNRWALISLLAGGALLSGRTVHSHSTSSCIGGDLYIDFYDDVTGGFRGYLRVRNATQRQ